MRKNFIFVSASRENNERIIRVSTTGRKEEGGRAAFFSFLFLEREKREKRETERERGRE